jgi:hypothetical protein
MPAPIDLSQIPARPRSPSKSFLGGGKPGRGTGTAIDEYARKVLWIALLVSLLLMTYLLFGLFSGAWAKEAMGHLYHSNIADYNRQMANIALVYQVLQFSTLIFVVSFLICCMRDESVGYVLVGIGLAFYAGLPFITSQVYDWRSLKTDIATGILMRHFQMLSWLFFLPGIIWVIGDLIRRFRSAAEVAAIQRANVKYGANVKKQPVVKQKQRFMGRCWELPYCRNEIRERCPIFIKRRGPCWWHKEGCMCEERIILQAVISTDWKQQAAKADSNYNFGQKRSLLTPAAKRQRCRNCIIYNEHQRQKYKVMVAIALVVLPVLLYLNADVLQSVIVHILGGMEAVMDRFSFGGSSSGISFLHGRPSEPIEWTLIGALLIIILAQVLKFIEFCCFKIKI